MSMPLLGFNVAQLSAVCSGQTAGIALVGNEHIVVLGLHNAEPPTPAEKMKIEALTLLSPERAREMALTLWNLADEVQHRNTGKEGV